MDDKTLTALKQSIDKWERNAVAETPGNFDVGAASCPLCKLFWEDDCERCPVRDETNEERCYGSPYDVALVAIKKWNYDPHDADLRASAQAAARAEVAFLRSLLPKAEADD